MRYTCLSFGATQDLSPDYRLKNTVNKKLNLPQAEKLLHRSPSHIEQNQEMGDKNAGAS